MKRGEVWWGEEPPPIGRRPFLIISADSLNDVRGLVLAAPITTRVRNVWTEVPVGPAEGLRRDCVAGLAGIMPVEKANLFQRAGVLEPAKQILVDSILARVFDVDTLAAQTPLS